MEVEMEVEAVDAADDGGDAGPSQAWNVATSSTTVAILEDLENQYVELKHDRDNLQLQLEDAQVKLRDLNQKVVHQQEWELQVTNYKHEVDLANSKISASENDRKLMQEQMDRQQAEADSLREEIGRLTTANSELATKCADFEIGSKITQSEAIPLYHEKQRLATELASLQSHSSWLEQEISSKSQQYQHLQRESRDRTIQLQLQLDQTISEKDGLSARLTALEKIEVKLQDKVKQLSLEHLNVQQELVTSRQNFETEVQEERRIINLQKEHLERWQLRYEDVVKENENLKSTAAHAMELSDKERNNELETMEQKYAALLREQAEEYERKIRDSSGAPSSGRRLLSLPAPEANTVDGDEDTDQDDRDDGPMSMTDLYERLERTKAALRKEQMDRKCWQLQFERVQKDIREAAPRLIRQREEYDMAVDQLSDYQRRLEMALSEREDARKEAAEARRMAGVIQNRLTERQAESQVLAKQVQALLVSRSGMVASGNGESGIIPTSISEMQNQNQRLLMEHRRMTQQIAELEEKLQTNELKNQLEHSLSELQTLQKEREEQEMIVERIVEQRDLYRALLAKHDSNLLGSEAEELTALEMAKHQAERAKTLAKLNVELEGSVKLLQMEKGRLSSDKEEMAARLGRHEAHSAELVKSNESLERDLLTARSNEARTSSEAQYHKDNCARLESSLERARSEIVQLNHARNELQRINTDLQQVLSIGNSERDGLETEKRQFENKIRLLQTQLEIAKSAEKRASDENGQLRAEVARQGTLIDSVRRIEACISVNSEGEKEGLRREKEYLTQQLAEESTRFKAEAENWKARQEELELNVQDMIASKEAINSEALVSAEKLRVATSEIEKIQTKYKIMESQLHAAKKKLGEDIGDVDEDVSTQTEIEKLESELMALKSERDAMRQSCDTYQNLAKENEKALLELQGLTDQMQAEKDEEVARLTRQLEAFKNFSESKDEMIRDLTNDLASHREENEKAFGDLKSKIMSLETEIQNNETDVQTAKAFAAAVSHDMEALREELTVAQINFERELGLHSQARTALRAAREEVDVQSRLRLTSDEKLEEMRKDVNEKVQIWDEEKTSTKQAMELLEKRIKDMHDQNSLLHTQLETLTDVVEKSQASRLAAPGESIRDSGASVDASSELREIVRFLRNENELIQTQLDTAKRVADREKAASNLLRRSLDEALAELKVRRSEKGESAGPAEEADSDVEDKLRNAEEQVVLLKDSNKLLRDQMEKLESQLSAMQTELEAATKSVEPAMNTKRTLESTVASLESERDSLRREMESWKDRVKNLVTKFHHIDPDEHKKLIAQVEDLQKEKETVNAWKKATEEESNRIRSIAKTLNQKNQQQKATIDSQLKDIEKLTAEKSSLAIASSANTAIVKELEELKEKIAKMVTDAESNKRELEGANSRNDRLREKLREFQTMIRELRAKEKALTGQLENAKSQAVSMKDKQTDSAVSHPSSERKSATVDSTEKSEQVTFPRVEKSVPSVPQGGFKFGPSESTRSQPDAQKIATTAALSASAPAFVPILETPELAKESTKAAELASPVAIRRSSAANQELSMKEQLLAKKMKLQEALKRKQEAGSAGAKAEISGASREPIAKRSKVESSEVTKGDTTIEPSAMSAADDKSAEIGLILGPNAVEASQGVSQEIVDENQGPSSDEIFVSAEDAKDSPVVHVDTSAEIHSQSNPFASFSSAKPTSSATTFEQFSGVVATQPTASENHELPSGSAFLDMKPPGSSAVLPTFTFGNSSSITLPTPSIPVPVNPFGAFGATSSFGGFGAPTGSTMPSMPLFGSNAPSQESKDVEKPNEQEISRD